MVSDHLSEKKEETHFELDYTLEAFSVGDVSTDAPRDCVPPRRRRESVEDCNAAQVDQDAGHGGRFYERR